MLSIKNLKKSIKNKTILNGLSLHADQGEIVVLLGASGVGKSTLLRILNNLDHADEGSITLNNAPITAHDQHHSIGMVFQNYNLFEHMTVIGNITLALEHVLGKKKEDAEATAYALLTKYGLADKAHHKASQLSGGQKQRLALARTLALKPSVVCLDEPTSALDPSLTAHIAQTITELAQEQYLVLVTTHDISLLEKLNCTIYLMDHGNIIESAQSKDFFEQKNRYPALHAFIKGSA